MSKEFAIKLNQVSKVYRLHGSQKDQVIDVLKLQRFGFKTKTACKEFSALKDISLNVPRGSKIGIVGRNGSGKTTLLKLLCGNFAPTRGTVEVNGTVQALMNIGLGFHPEFTGRENVESSLQYNGLDPSEYQTALEDIISFCELRDYFDQPFKTYSLGMQARLMFAAATAIKPDILIVDEVLGAGDAYFVAKSKVRVQKLVNSGCTMLLVSHSMSQILELCDEVIWLHEGEVRMRGPSFSVVKAYEEFLHGPIGSVSMPVVEKPGSEQAGVQEQLKSEAGVNGSIKNQESQRNLGDLTKVVFQEPYFLPHSQSPMFPLVGGPMDFKFVAPGGVSRWESDPGLKIIGFTILSHQGETSKLSTMQPAKFLINVIAESEGLFNCRCAMVIFDHLGNCVTRLISPVETFELKSQNTRCFELLLNPVQLGPGEYFISLSLHKLGELETINSNGRYDLLNRTFMFEVTLPDSLTPLSTQFFHTGEWILAEASE